MARKVGQCILIIEDEIPVRTTLSLIFEASGYKVFKGSTAKEGLHLFTSNPVDLVLLDFRLPDDGTWLGQELKRRKPRVPIVVLSGAPEAIQATSYADALLPKPMEPPDLLKRVAELLGRARSA